MVKACLAIAAALLAVAAVGARAESPSYESRGYGGPLYVGPNFNSGKPSAETGRKKRVQHAPKRRAPVAKAPAARKVETAKVAPAASEAESENSSISGVALDAGATAGDGTAPKAVRTTSESSESSSSANRKLRCVKYLPTAGITAQAPCE